MNVSCTNCGKRYVIADEKLVGKKSVRIRCKQCQSLISITVPEAVAEPAPPPAEEPSPWAEERTRAMPAMDTAATWYAMVGGAQIGPLDAHNLTARLQAKEVTLRSFLWKPGMDDWKRASDIPELSPLLAGVTFQASAPPPPPPKREARVATPIESSHAPEPDEPPPPEAQALQPQAQAPQPQAQAQAPQPGPLSDLFSDVSAQTELPAPDATPPGDEDAPAEAAHDEPNAAADPFAQLSGGDDAQAPPIGEATRFFIAQAGVNKRNPPWKIALFIALFIGLPVGLVFLLQSFHIVELPTVTHTDADGTVTQEPFFSPGGMSGLKDILTGDAKRRQEEAARKARERVARAKTPSQAPGEEPPPTPKVQDPDVAAFYQESGTRTVAPRVRKTDGAPAAVDAAGLSAEAVSRVVADKSKAFQLCIDQALHRNPNLAVGNITVVLSVSRSGAVKAASIEPKKHEGADWAQCMMGSARRIVFPASDGETQVELPFKVGVAVVP